MISHGVQPVRRKKHHLSTRSFGASTPSYEPFNYDAGFGFPDQNAEGFPEDCLIYSTNEVGQDEDKVHFNRAFLKGKVLSVTGHQGPYQAEDVVPLAVVYGLQAEGETTDAQAYAHKRGEEFWLEKNPGMDWYDSLLAAMEATGCSFIVIGPWFPAFEDVGSTGIILPTFPLKWTSEPGHARKDSGLDAGGYLIEKSWQGPGYGQGGYTRWSREAFNDYMLIPGTGAVTLVKWTGALVQIETGILYNLRVQLALWRRLLFGS